MSYTASDPICHNCATQEHGSSPLPKTCVCGDYSATEAMKRQPMKEFVGPLSGRVYFEVRKGLRWEVWFSYQDGAADPNGSTQWKATTVRYWRWISAARAANDLWASFNAGVWCESERMACDLVGRKGAA